MPCDGKNPNCDRRRELLAQLKCLISSMDRKKPCEWDEPSCSPMVCPVESSCFPYCGPVKLCKSFEFRASIMNRCECIRRNGLQDRCMMSDCMGRPECMTKLYPVCGPGRAALLKLTDLGDMEIALKKFYCTDQAREAALAAYCRLACDQARQKQILSCSDALCCTPMMSAARSCLDDCSSPYPFCMSSPCTLQPCCPPYTLEEQCVPVMQYY